MFAVVLEDLCLFGIDGDVFYESMHLAGALILW